MRNAIEVQDLTKAYGRNAVLRELSFSVREGEVFALLGVNGAGKTTTLGLPQSLVQARESGVLNAYRVAGIPSWSLPLSTIIISFVHIMIVALIILISAPYLFQAAWPDSIPLHLFFVSVVALASESLGTLLASFVKKQASLALVGQFLFLPTILLSGIMFPRNLLPKPFQYLGEILPATQAMKLISNGNFQLTPLLILIAITVSAFAVSVIRFRRISLRA